MSDCTFVPAAPGWFAADPWGPCPPVVAWCINEDGFTMPIIYGMVSNISGRGVSPVEVIAPDGRVFDCDRTYETLHEWRVAIARKALQDPAERERFDADPSGWDKLPHGVSPEEVA